jgi:hypothetical protein
MYRFVNSRGCTEFARPVCRPSPSTFAIELGSTLRWFVAVPDEGLRQQIVQIDGGYIRKE